MQTYTGSRVPGAFWPLRPAIFRPRDEAVSNNSDASRRDSCHAWATSWRVFVVLAGAVGCCAAVAEETAIETVVVIGERPETSDTGLAGSVDVIGRDELRYEHVDDTLELFSRVPGTYLQRFNQGIINTDLSIRGFAGDGSTPHGKLLIDGIPSNLHNGYGELDQLFPLGIDSIQVFKGTSDPRYGLFNVAGNYNVASRSDTDTRVVEATVGSFDTRELQSYFGIESGNLTHNYFVGYRESEGYRERTDLQKFSASGRWFYDFSEDTTLGFIARISGYEGDAPGYLGRDEARLDPESSASFADQDGGDKDIQHYSLHFRTSFSPDVEWSLKTYFQSFERERWVRFSEAGALQNRFDNQEQTGLVSQLSWDVAADWTFIWGVDYQDQQNIEQRFGTIGQSRQRDVDNVVRDFDYDLTALGSYLKVENNLNDYIRWNVGVRIDHLDGDFVQFGAQGVGTDRDIFDFGTIVQPKLNVFVAPTDELTLFANYGRSFQHPFGSSLYTTGADDAKDVSLNDGWEVGASWSPSERFDLRLSHWRQNASDEFVDVDGTAENVGETERSGWDFGANWRLSDGIYLWANYSLIDTEIVDAGADPRGTVGNELRGVPDFTASVGANYQISDALGFRLHVDARGDAFFNESNLGGRFGEFTLVGLSAHYDMGWGLLSGQINNLFDEFFEYAFDFGQDGTATIHSPGDGRNASISLSYRF